MGLSRTSGRSLPAAPVLGAATSAAFPRAASFNASCHHGVSLLLGTEPLRAHPTSVWWALGAKRKALVALPGL